jgi:hypothetical protein
MIEPDIPQDLQIFMRDHLESYEQLEILIRLRAHPERTWAPHSISSELRIDEAISEEALRFLCRQGLLGVDIGKQALLFKYEPKSSELDALVGRLVQAYDTERLAVMRLMTANSIERLRTKALKKFSDSFILARKKDKDG